MATEEFVENVSIQNPKYNDDDTIMNEFNRLTSSTELEVKNTSFSPFIKQIIAASGAIILNIGSGMTTGFSGTVLGQLNSTFILDDEKISWIASMATLPMPIGGIVSGILMDNYGRRNVQILYSFLCIIGWIWLFLAQTLTHLYIGRLITGICVGLMSPSSTVYVAEISHPKHRGFILSLISLAISAGILISHTLGILLHWRALCWISSLVPAVSLIPIYFCPESPTWLICKGRTKEAENSFYWLRGINKESKNELLTLYEKHGNAPKSSATKKYKFNRNILSYLFVKPFVITCVFFIVQQFSGVNVIVFYTINVLGEFAQSSKFNKYTQAILIDSIRVIMSVIACLLLGRYARRTLFLISAIGSILSLIGISTYQQIQLDGFYASLIPVLCIIFYIVFSSIGIIPLPWIMTGEIYPVAVRDFGTGASNCFAFITMFTVVKTAPFLFSAIEVFGTFGLYSIITFLGTIFLFFYLPETKNKTLQQVEDNLRNVT